MTDKVKFLILCIVAFFPNKLKVIIYIKIFGAQIEKTAKIGISILMAKKITIGAYSRVGHFTLFRNLEELNIGSNVIIGNFIRATAIPLSAKGHFPHASHRVPALKLGKHSAITGRHYLDCNDTIEIGEFSTIAGLGSSIFTHGINLETNQQQTKKVSIGRYCMVSANCVIVKGAILPDFSVLGANSTLHKPYKETYTLYSGVPAMPVKKLSSTSEYFLRTNGVVV